MVIALVGNPNSGKTSIFNILTGARQHVGNWGGVTVELKEGVASYQEEKITIVDLPGTYSLSAYSIEEKVARDFIVEKKPDAVINVLDSTNLERNLYLTVQLMELGIRPVLAFNMWDEVKSKNLSIDRTRLQRLLDVPIVPTVAKNATGIGSLLSTAVETAKKNGSRYHRPLAHTPDDLNSEIAALRDHTGVRNVTQYAPGWTAMKLFEKDEQVEELVRSVPDGTAALKQRDEASLRIEERLGIDPESLIAESRFGFIAGALRESVKQKVTDRVELSDRIDSFLTHPVLAYPIFLLFMWLLFQATFVLGQYPMNWIESFFAFMGDTARAVLPTGPVQDLITEGIIGGVGGVAVFLPNILILFFGISIMEDTGYLARAAFIMDRIMHRAGLHGKSFIPVLIGLGCNVPAIMAARTLESERDRIKTILLAPLISCSARLPVYILLAGALFPNNAGNIVFLFQFVLGTTAFFLMGILFKKTLFKGEDHPFVMELPPYRVPTLRSVTIHMWHRAEHYLKKMGGVVLVFSIILWFLGSYPKSPEVVREYEQRIENVQENPSLSLERRSDAVRDLRNEMGAEIMGRSYIGRLGKFLSPLTDPLGFDWRATLALITGFVAKELVVGTMGVLYAVDPEEGAESEELQERLAQFFTPLTAFGFMLFVLLYTPCIVAVVTVVREVKSWKWSVFSVSYQILLAWLAAFVVYQGGRLVGLG